MDGAPHPSLGGDVIPGSSTMVPARRHIYRTHHNEEDYAAYPHAEHQESSGGKPSNNNDGSFGHGHCSVIFKCVQLIRRKSTAPHERYRNNIRPERR